MALGLCFATVGGVSSSMLWCRGAQSAKVLQLLSSLVLFQQNEHYFPSFLVSWLHASQALFLSSGIQLTFAAGHNSLDSAEDDDMPVMCLAEAVSIL